MGSRKTQDILSSLPDHLRVIIISFLPFKDALKTSVLSKRWKNICYETTNISFKESQVVKFSDSEAEETRIVSRASFIYYTIEWVSRFSGECIKSFEFCLSNPVGFESEIKLLIDFAVSKQVKYLILNFSDNNQKVIEANVFPLPESFYNFNSLESLKLLGCEFDPSRFWNSNLIKYLCFGWMNLKDVMSLISRSPSLKSLTIENCWNIGLEMITGYNNRLTHLKFENCEFTTEYTTLNLTNIQSFKHIGKFHYFQFMEANRMMKEAYLDFAKETEYDSMTGTHICSMLYDMSSAKMLTVCPFLIQMIQESDDPSRLQAPMETKHLVIKTNLQPNEFVGIRSMINSCPDLEILTFVMIPQRPILPTAFQVDLENYWSQKITHKCLKSTLRVVEVKNFCGGFTEVLMLQYLIKHGLVLERVDFYLSRGLEEGKKILARAAAEFIGTKFVRGSKRLRVVMHSV